MAPPTWRSHRLRNATIPSEEAMLNLLFESMDGNVHGLRRLTCPGAGMR